MMAAVGALVEVRGIMKLMQRVLFGLSFVVSEDGSAMLSNREALENPKSVIPKSSTLWTMCKTLLVHRTWRRLPLLSLKLTEPPARALECLPCVARATQVPPKCRPSAANVPSKCRPSAANVPSKCRSSAAQVPLPLVALPQCRLSATQVPLAAMPRVIFRMLLPRR